jgi:hypothetical protein
VGVHEKFLVLGGARRLLEIHLRQAEIDLPLRKSRTCIAGDATVLGVNADRLHF